MPRVSSSFTASWKAIRSVAGAGIEDQRQALVTVGIAHHQLGQAAQQFGGQVVDDPVAQVLEQLAGGCLARARQPADDRDVRAWRETTADESPAARSATAGGAATRRMVSSYSGYITSAMIVGLNGSPPGVTTTATTKMPRNT